MGSVTNATGQDLGTLLAGKLVEWPAGATRSRIAVAQLGGVRGFEVQAPAVRITAPARPNAEPFWHLIVHLAGRGRYRVARREIEQRPGAVLLADGRTNCFVDHPEGTHVVSWVLPGELVSPYMPAYSEPVMELTGGIGMLLGDHAVALARGAAHVEASADEALIAHLAALVGLALGTRKAHEKRNRSSHSALMRQRCIGLIEARFREPDLTATTAAGVLGISRRWLHALLVDSGSGFSERIRARRLAESMRLLRDPSADHLSVTQIGYAVGFNDLSTFHRQFRRLHGISPNQARRERE